MTLESLREEVLQASLEMLRHGLVLYTFGNVSGVARAEGLVVIKPSGVPYEEMQPSDMVVVDLAGRVVEGRLRPSSDLPTHLALYRAFPQIGGVAHTHSRYATAWAQAGRDLPCLGTSHADYFHGPVPVTAPLSADEIQGDYETNTGEAIVRRFAGLDPLEMPAALVLYHGPFTWGRSPGEAAQNAALLEEVARMAFDTLLLQPSAAGLPQSLRDRHFYRKHGAAAYYGQRPPDQD